MPNIVYRRGQMDWNAILDEIKTIGTALGTVIFTGYITYKTFS